MSRPRPDMSERRTRSGGAAKVSGPMAASPTKSLRRSQRKSGSDLPSTLPEIRPKAPDAAAAPAPARKPIVLKKIVAHVVEVPSAHSPRRSPRPPSEPKLDLQPEPTVKFLSTLLSAADTPEAKRPEVDLEIQESRFLDKEDWGARRTSEEFSHLQNACKRLQESLNTIQADNLALREKLQNLPDTLYKNLKEEGKATQEEAQEPTPRGGPGCSGWTGSTVASDKGGHTSLPLPETA
ncbi:sororin isoform X3 [Phyllostomus discolor]|uniref:Sororin isoform X3 n=1 Tax=Phyllostomus discolor TaxID=89673 RepID=A0A7E6E3I6_9CHIR|nr:sororin isoform X3 [Phyllostomus discolor]